MKHLAILAVVTGLLAGSRPLNAQNNANSAVPNAASDDAQAAPAPTNQPGLQTVIIVYKTHFDIGYTSSAREVVHEYRTEMADRVLDAIEENQQAAQGQAVRLDAFGLADASRSSGKASRPSGERRSSRRSATATSPSTRLPFSMHTETAGAGGPGPRRAGHLLDALPPVRPAAFDQRQDDRRAGAVVGLPDAVRPRRASSSITWAARW